MIFVYFNEYEDQMKLIIHIMLKVTPMKENIFIKALKNLQFKEGAENKISLS